MTKLSRLSGQLVASTKIRIARTETYVDAEARIHDVGGSKWLVDWIFLDGEWRILRAGDGIDIASATDNNVDHVTNGHRPQGPLGIKQLLGDKF